MSAITTIERQLREAIEASGQSYRQLGQVAGVDSGRLSRFMRGERGLTLEAVGRLCEILGLKFCPSGTPSTSTTSKPKKETTAEASPKKDADIIKPPVKKTARKRKEK